MTDVNLEDFSYGTTVHTSHHKTEKEAALMYNKVAVKYYKDYVRLNNVI